MPTKYPVIEWHMLGTGEQIAKVFGGWLIKTDNPLTLNFPDRDGGTVNNFNSLEQLVFIPDPEHQWPKIQEMEELIRKEQVT